MPYFALIMLAVSLLGFVIAVVMSLTAYKNSVRDSLLNLGIIFTNVIFTAVAAWLIYVRSFAVDVSMTMKTPCYVLGLLTFICCIIQGNIIKIEIKNGKTEKLTEKIVFPEILSIAGILYFFIQSKIPL